MSSNPNSFSEALLGGFNAGTNMAGVMERVSARKAEEAARKATLGEQVREFDNRNKLEQDAQAEHVREFNTNQGFNRDQLAQQLTIHSENLGQNMAALRQGGEQFRQSLDLRKQEFAQQSQQQGIQNARLQNASSLFGQAADSMGLIPGSSDGTGMGPPTPEADQLRRTFDLAGPEFGQHLFSTLVADRSKREGLQARNVAVTDAVNARKAGAASMLKQGLLTPGEYDAQMKELDAWGATAGVPGIDALPAMHNPKAGAAQMDSTMVLKELADQRGQYKTILDGIKAASDFKTGDDGLKANLMKELDRVQGNIRTLEGHLYGAGPASAVGTSPVGLQGQKDPSSGASGLPGPSAGQAGTRGAAGAGNPAAASPPAGLPPAIPAPLERPTGPQPALNGPAGGGTAALKARLRQMYTPEEATALLQQIRERGVPQDIKP